MSEPRVLEVDPRDRLINEILGLVRSELLQALERHPVPFHSPHEGFGVIREELDPELWEHVCGDSGRSPEAMVEAIQVAAMAVRYVMDLDPQWDRSELAGPADPVLALEEAEWEVWVTESILPARLRPIPTGPFRVVRSVEGS